MLFITLPVLMANLFVCLYIIYHYINVNDFDFTSLPEVDDNERSSIVNGLDGVIVIDPIGIVDVLLWRWWCKLLLFWCWWLTNALAIDDGNDIDDDDDDDFNVFVFIDVDDADGINGSIMALIFDDSDVNLSSLSVAAIIAILNSVLPLLRLLSSTLVALFWFDVADDTYGSSIYDVDDDVGE